MARKGYGDAIYYGAIVIGGYTAYKMAKQGSFGTSARVFAEGLSDAWTPKKALAAAGGSASKTGTSETTHSAATGPTASMPAQAATSLQDMGRVPLVWVNSQQLLKQDPSWVSKYAPDYQPNSYGAGAIVFEQGSGQQLQYLGGGKLLDVDSGTTVDILAYIIPRQ